MIAKIILKGFLVLCANTLVDASCFVNNAKQEHGVQAEKQVDSTKIINQKSVLTKAKRDKDTIEIAEAYENLALLLFPSNETIKYADSIIEITGYLKQRHKKYPASAYNAKGATYYIFGDYKKALDNYITALEHISEKNNPHLYLTVKFNIGLLKNHLNEREEAQKWFKEYLSAINHIDNPKGYLKGLYALSDSYVYTKKSDLASTTIKEGINYSLKLNDTTYYAYFLLTSGVNGYFQNNPKIAIDSLKKATVLLSRFKNEHSNIATSNYFIGKSLLALEKEKEGIHYMKKVDSILSINPDVSPELLNTYHYLIDDAKSKQQKEQELKYINALLRLDSILSNDYKYLKNNIVEKYDKPQLLLEKEQLIKQLSEEATLSKTTIVILSILSFSIFGVLLYFIARNQKHKRRYLEIKNNIESKSKKEVTKEDNIQVSEIDLPEEVVSEILNGLKNFEESEKYTEKKYTLNSLAKELNTNSAYLSKVINSSMQVNFSNYLNNLRVEYAIEKLAKSEKFRSYTIKAIAEESGFSTAQSFSTAFYKITGIYPSYFIKRLNKDNAAGKL